MTSLDEPAAAPRPPDSQPAASIPSHPPAPPASRSALRRALAWRPEPLRAFLAALVSLAAIAAISLLTPIRIVTGMPGLPEVRAARAALGARGLEVPAGELRFACSLAPAGETPGRAPILDLSPDQSARLATAERWLREAERRDPRDVRLPCGLAHLHLAAGRLERAERAYRAVLGRAPHYGEARLGLGITLAVRALTRGDTPEARALLLAAIAQLAAVTEKDPVHLPALYDRALLLARVERMEEARRWAADYARRDPGSEWTRRLAVAVAVAAGR